MCIASSPKFADPDDAAKPPEAPPEPEVLDQKGPGESQLTKDAQLLALQLGLNQLKISPGVSLTAK